MRLSRVAAGMGTSLLLVLGAGGGALAAPGEPSLGAGQVEVAQYVDALTVQAASDPQAASTLKGFEALSPADQASFVGYLTDPSVLTLPTTDGRFVSHGGDVVTTATTSTTRTPELTTMGTSSRTAASTRQTRSVTSTFSQKVLGVTFARYTQTFVYVTENNRVVSTSACYGTARNYMPTMSVSDSSYHYLFGLEAKCDTVWTVHILYKGSNFRIDKVQTTRVNGIGMVWRSMNNA